MARQVLTRVTQYAILLLLRLHGRCNLKHLCSAYIANRTILKPMLSSFTGTGKTSLLKALAQKLAIKLNHRFGHTPT